jgi:stearoyl-CoA desaturase (delta-9 desaturase)
MVVVTATVRSTQDSAPVRQPARRDLTTMVMFGFNVDRLGKRRRPEWMNIAILGVAFPGLSLWAVYRIFTTPTGLGLWALAAVLYAFTLLGVTMGNHRYWTHRGFKARLPLQLVLAVASAMSVEGDIQQWVTTHRTHHRHADVIGLDPHSPYEYQAWHGLKGLLWAQGIWMMFDYADTTHRAVPHDLAANRLVQRQRKAFPVIAIGQYVLLLACYPVFGINGVLIAGVLRTTVLMTSTGFVNSLCHRWGSRARDSRGREYRRDDSRNNVLVAVLAGGEGNHSWHHVDPTCPRHGRQVDLDPEAVAAGVMRDRGWRPDVTWRAIQLLDRLGLIYDLKLPSRTIRFAPALCEPTPSLRDTHHEWRIPDPEPTISPEPVPAGPSSSPGASQLRN